ncbi:hypothetical protein SCLCIDRAFT_1219969 [Scleroderma citrinum Foug A]|uniref:Uncharacterized protein n=1 Tax=Scleroderma citrinum Foug A TaxID=1036808 RepID=A0A0C3DKV9_9AGAM|nr:hypothetical protein SCLCIDRAFT_1219969 [Scleroderma citrinum Foug A]
MFHYALPPTPATLVSPAVTPYPLMQPWTLFNTSPLPRCDKHYLPSGNRVLRIYEYNRYSGNDATVDHKPTQWLHTTHTTQKPNQQLRENRYTHSRSGVWSPNARSTFRTRRP